MPQLFPILIRVEEVALGKVMRTLHNTPGVAKVDLLLGDTKSAANGNGHLNGHANGEDKPKKKRFVAEDGTTGADRLIQLLKKKPHKVTGIKAAFEKEGRAPDSASSLIHLAKQNGLIESKPDGYHLTKRGRDKARYV